MSIEILYDESDILPLAFRCKASLAYLGLGPTGYFNFDLIPENPRVGTHVDTAEQLRQKQSGKVLIYE